jgi:hypothetical protein
MSTSSTPLPAPASFPPLKRRKQPEALPEVLHVRRRTPVEIVASLEIRYYLPLEHSLEIKWGLTRATARPNDVPYVRKFPESQWGVRVDILPQEGGIHAS